jgi:hypothetical protein
MPMPRDEATPQGLSRPVHAVTGFPLRIEEASISDRGLLMVRVAWTGEPDAAPSALAVVLGGRDLGRIGAAMVAGRRLYQGRYDLGAATRVARLTVASGTDEVGIAVGGRLSPASAWFADATWTADADAARVLASSMPSVLVLSDLLPSAGAALWAPVANFAAIMRQVGYRPVLLHFGTIAACGSEVARLLAHFDIVHHHGTALPQQAWDAASPGTLPPVDRALPQTIAAIAAASGAAMAVAVSPGSLNILGKLPPGLRRGALLTRDFVRAPRMIFSPVPREKAAATLRGILAGVTVILEDEGLRLELEKWLPGAPGAVLPPFVALPAPVSHGGGHVVAVGTVAARASGQFVPMAEPVSVIDDATPLDAIYAALAEADSVAMWSDAGPPGLLVRRLAALAGVPVIGQAPSPLPHGTGEEADIAALVALMTDYRTRGTALPPEAGVAWSAAGFATELGLPVVGDGVAAGSSGLLRRLLEMRLEGVPDRAKVGLLVDPQRPEAVMFAAAFDALVGPGRVFAHHPPAGLGGILPLGRALASGIEAVLVDLGQDSGAGMALMERVLDGGLLPMPLAPRASWRDCVGLAALRGTGAGKVAYIGDGLLPAGADLLLVPGAAQVALADAVDLTDPADPRRGRLVTLFAANRDVFWRRPPAPALGYDCDAAAVGLELGTGLPVTHEAVPMLALANLMGCERIMVAAHMFREPALAAALAALSRAGVSVSPAAELALESNR